MLDMIMMRLRLHSIIASCLIFFAVYDAVDGSPFFQQSPPPLSRSWGILDYYGGDSTPILPIHNIHNGGNSNNDDNDDDDSNDKTIVRDNDKSENSILEKYTSSSQILNSVSAGGGSPSDQLFTAFVGSAGVGTGAASGAATSAMASNTAILFKRSSSSTSSSSPPGIVAELNSPPVMIESSSSSTSLSVASNKQKDIEAIATTSQETISKNEEKDAYSTTTTATIDNAQENQQRPPLRILFLSSDTGGGHRASAEALAAQFQILFPGSTYDLLDVWTDVESSWPYYTIKETYKSFSATPWKWRALYHVSNNALYAKLADLHSYYMNEDLITQKLEEYSPDVIVSVHPTMNYVPLHSARKISNKIGRDIPFFTVVTDFGSGHCHWFNKDVDKMYLASEPIKQIALSRGNVPEEKIVMSGLPIRYDFAAQADAIGDRTTDIGKAHQAKIRKELNIDTNKRMVLVMGGGEGVGSLSDIVNELYAKLRTQGVDATICVVCGRNEKLKADLETRCWDTVVSQSLQSYESLKSRIFTKILTRHAHRSRRIQLALDRAAAKSAKGNDTADTPGKVDVLPLGFVTNMAEYMVAADVLVSKAGPGTIAEAAAVGLPVMVTSYLPGQEAGNVEIVLNGGFGDFCSDPETIALELACWLQDSQLLDVMSKKAMKVGNPHAAEQIAMDIGKIVQEKLSKYR